MHLRTCNSIKENFLKGGFAMFRQAWLSIYFTNIDFLNIY